MKSTNQQHPFDHYLIVQGSQQTSSFHNSNAQQHDPIIIHSKMNDNNDSILRQNNNRISTDSSIEMIELMSEKDDSDNDDDVIGVWDGVTLKTFTSPDTLSCAKPHDQIQVHKASIQESSAALENKTTTSITKTTIIGTKTNALFTNRKHSLDLNMKGTTEFPNTIQTSFILNDCRKISESNDGLTNMDTQNCHINEVIMDVVY